MRPIKFRAWLPNSKFWWTWENIQQGTVYEMFTPGYGEKILNQFTGFFDKRGTEIYEGDIVYKNETYFEIVFNEGAAKFAIGRYRGKWRPAKCGKIYAIPKAGLVVGNIYENIELLTHLDIDEEEMEISEDFKELLPKLGHVVPSGIPPLQIGGTQMTKNRLPKKEECSGCNGPREVGEFHTCRDINKLPKELNIICAPIKKKDVCSHPIDALEIKHTGKYEKQKDRYQVEHYCKLCLKKWYEWFYELK